MRYRQSLILIIGTAIAFTIWEIIGHWFLMYLPMDVRHGLSIVIGTGLALFIATVSIRVIWSQQQELHELARLRDYLLRMQSHYLHLSPEARIDPQQQLEYTALELKYSDIQNNLVSQSPEIRASGLLDLKELAQTHISGLREPYPFFFCAVTHLTAVLYLESEIAPRNQALESLEEMAGFAHDSEPHLLDSLVNDLAHVNRTSLSMLSDALADHFGSMESVSSENYELILPLVRFTDSEETDRAVLHDLIDSPLCQDSLAARRILHKGVISQKTDEAALLKRIRNAAIKLRDTRNALAQALRALSTPSDIPTDKDALRGWKRIRPLILHTCFLVGTDLNKTQLHGVDLNHAALQAANLTDCQLMNSDMTAANLRNAQLFAAKLDNAKLWSANFQEATLTSARLHGADMSRAQLQRAHLIGADLKDTCLWQIIVSNDPQKREHSANFTEANWWEARFNDQLSGSTDTVLLSWLKNSYPQPDLKIVIKTGTK